MIDLNCIKCQAAMQVDEAFAGSACRCQRCGTIQTVPTKRRSAQPAGSATSSAGKSLYTHQSRSGNAGSGLDALADVVSSGISSGLSAQLGSAGKRPSRRGPLMAAIIGGGVGILLTVIVVAFVITRPDKPTAPQANNSVPSSNSPGKKTPSFCGIELKDSVIIYVLDRGNSTRDTMGYVAAATVQSLKSLGTDRRFQIMFWDNGQTELTVPVGAPQFATAETIAAAQRSLDGVVAFGRTDAIPALKKALAARPGAIVLVTAKGSELDDSFNSAVLAMRSTVAGNTRINTVAIGDPGESFPKLAQSAGGTHATVTPGELKEFGQ